MSKDIIEQLLDAGIIWYAKTAPSRFVLSMDEYKVGDLVYAQLDDPENPSSEVYIVPVPIALINGENKHTHEIEVFGAPCLGGDYHEYCLKCGWVEPCEIDGENN